MPGTGPYGPGLGRAVDRHQAEALAISALPFEVVERRPVDEAADIASASDRPLHRGNRSIDEHDPTRVVVGRDTALGDHHGDTGGDLPGPADRVLERLGP